MAEETTRSGGSGEQLVGETLYRPPAEIAEGPERSVLVGTNRTVPTVGCIVHYVSYGTPGGEFLPEHRAAIIAGVPFAGNPGDDLVDLVVFNPQGLFFNRVPYLAEPTGGTWHWPERADG